MRSLGRFEDYLVKSERLRAVSGLTEADYARARNNGRRRTPDKRLFLEGIAERARAAGVEPLPAHF